MSLSASTLTDLAPPHCHTLSLQDALPISPIAPLSGATTSTPPAGIEANATTPALTPIAPLPSVAANPPAADTWQRSEEHTSELQSLRQLVCRLLLEKKNKYLRR